MCTIKKEDLRPCTFTLEGHNLLGHAQPGMFDYANNQEREETTRERIGRFHTWGLELQPQTTDGNMISCGIVEDTANGKIYRVNPENIHFTD